MHMNAQLLLNSYGPKINVLHMHMNAQLLLNSYGPKINV